MVEGGVEEEEVELPFEIGEGHDHELAAVGGFGVGGGLVRFGVCFGGDDGEDYEVFFDVWAGEVGGFDGSE